MNYLLEHAFKATVRARIKARAGRGLRTDFDAIFEELTRNKLAPANSDLWAWARKQCKEAAA